VFLIQNCEKWDETVRNGERLGKLAVTVAGTGESQNINYKILPRFLVRKCI